MAEDLFSDSEHRLAPFEHTYLFKGMALKEFDSLWWALQKVICQAPLAQLKTPSGKSMSVLTTSCGDYGWHSDHRGYRYCRKRAATNLFWPSMPHCFLQLASSAAQLAGFNQFMPDSCLINQYQLDTQMGLHQDRDEADFSQPIVSVSLGMSAEFMIGGFGRNDAVLTTLLDHGDVMVWGGGDRLRFHGIKPLRANPHPQLGAVRYNLTFRKAR